MFAHVCITEARILGELKLVRKPPKVFRGVGDNPLPFWLKIFAKRSLVGSSRTSKPAP